jgi:hypothetical protein
VLEKAAMAVESEVLKVARIPVKRLKEWSGGEDEAARPKDPKHLFDSAAWMLEVFEDCLAMNWRDGAVLVWESVGRGHDVYVRKRTEVQIREARMDAPWTAAHRKADAFLRARRNDECEGSMGSNRTTIAAREGDALRQAA